MLLPLMLSGASARMYPSFNINHYCLKYSECGPHTGTVTSEFGEKNNGLFDAEINNMTIAKTDDSELRHMHP